MTDRHGLAIGLPMAAAILLKKQIQYRYSHGIGMRSPVVSLNCLAEMGFSWVIMKILEHPLSKNRKRKKRT